MTFDQCNAALTTIRRNQGTKNPRVRVDLAGSAYAGRVSRADCDKEPGRLVQGPYGVLILENLGLNRYPQTILQIADIPDGGIQAVDEN